MWGCVEFVLKGKKNFDNVIWGWGKQLEILIVATGEYCRLLTAKTQSVRGLSEQLTFMGWRLSTRVCPVHLADELVLVLYTAFCWRSFFGGGKQVTMILVSWELMLFLFIYYFIFLLAFIYLFLIKGLFTIKYKYYAIFK